MDACSTEAAGRPLMVLIIIVGVAILLLTGYLLTDYIKRKRRVSKRIKKAKDQMVHESVAYTERLSGSVRNSGGTIVENEETDG